MKLQDIAERLQCRLEGDGTIEISRVAGIEHAKSGDLTFVANPKYQSHLGSTGASAVIVSQDAACNGVRPAVLRSDQPALSFAKAVALLAQSAPPASPSRGIDRTSSIAADARIGADVSIGPLVTIGAGASVGARTIVYPNVVIGPGARIGDDCVIHSQASIRERVQIGNRVVLQDGVVVGSDGFGFVKQPDGTHFKIPQHADVVIEDDVEIGANTTIDRPAVGETRIGAGAKIDNLVQMAHGVSVGRRVLFAAQVGIAGSTVDRRRRRAGRTGGRGRPHPRRQGRRGDRRRRACRIRSTPASSSRAIRRSPNRDWLKSSAVFRQLPDAEETRCGPRAAPSSSSRSKRG